MENVINAINSALWGTPTLLLLTGCGVYFSVRLGFFQIVNVNVWMKKTIGTLFSGKAKTDVGISPFRAVSSALASSIGTGSIVGVATAITSGGAGAVFWMWISAIVGMAVKYAEIYLAVHFRKEKDGEFYGGPMYYIESGLGKDFRWLSVIFSIAGALACLGMGAMNQSNSIASVMKDGINIPTWITGAVLSAIASIALCGGIARISRFAELLVPIMAIMYFLGGVAIIIISPQSALGTISEIFTSALAPRAVYGGMAGVMIKSAMRFGIARGMFSNEAGLGSAPIVHAAANCKSPSEQGMWGVFEVFVDTGVVCTVTAIAVISSGLHKEGLAGAVLVTKAFSHFLGSFGGVFVGIATIMFSLTTILGWSYYGERCVTYLANERKSAGYFYRALFVAAVMAGAVLSVGSVWELADMFNGIMMIPNVIALVLLSDIVIDGTRGIKNQ